jgi:iron complex transport system permease protein
MVTSDKIKRWMGWFIVLVILLLGISFLSLTIGPVRIPLTKSISLLTQKLCFWRSYPLENTPAAVILFKIRIPRLILGMVVGAALSSAGVILQGMFRNPLVEPYTLGISGGAAAAVGLVIIAGLSGTLTQIIPLAGFAGAIGAAILVYFIASSGGRLTIPTLLLTGVIVSFLSSSLIMLLMSLAKGEELHGIMFWIMGNLQETNLSFIITVSLIILTGIFISFLFARDLNALVLGEEEATHLGIEVERTKKILFILASLLTGVAVSASGVIGFVGLMIPHLIRGVVDADHRFLLPASALLGASFLVGADLIARTIISPRELPVGVITGIIGGIIFIYIIRKRKVEFRW